MSFEAFVVAHPSGGSKYYWDSQNCIYTYSNLALKYDCEVLKSPEKYSENERLNCSNPKLKEMLEKHPKFIVVDEQLYNSISRVKPELLPIANNKVINLITGEIRTRIPADLFTYQATMKYYPVNVYPRATQYFEQLCSQHEALQNYLGGVLVGQNKEPCLLTGRGKTTLYHLLIEISPRFVGAILTEGIASYSFHLTVTEQQRYMFEIMTPHLAEIMSWIIAGVNLS